MPFHRRIDGNPLFCGCPAQQLAQYIKSKKGKFAVSSATCKNANNEQTVSIFKVNLECGKLLNSAFCVCEIINISSEKSEKGQKTCYSKKGKKRFLNQLLIQ